MQENVEAMPPTYRPFIDDPEHLASLEGQRFVVLRPTGLILDSYAEFQDLMKTRFPGWQISYPSHAHVTLGGFPKGTPVSSIQALASEWAAETPPLRLEVECAAIFPSPFQIVIVQIRRTADLLSALLRLRGLARKRGIQAIETIPAADWIFHMSVAYCSSLTASDWGEVSNLVENTKIGAAQCLVEDVEIVAVDEGHEYAPGSVRLAARASNPD
jgi:hypothetical protein